MFRLWKVPAENVVLAILALHPKGRTFTEVQNDDVWMREAGWPGKPSIRRVARAGKSLADANLIREHGKRWRLIVPVPCDPTS